jgi:ferredoxin
VGCGGWRDHNIDHVCRCCVGCSCKGCGVRMTRDKDLIGKRVELLRCTDEYTKIPMGTQGVVTSVDDANTVHVMLGLIYEAGDRWLVIGK